MHDCNIKVFAFTKLTYTVYCKMADANPALRWYNIIIDNNKEMNYLKLIDVLIFNINFLLQYSQNSVHYIIKQHNYFKDIVQNMFLKNLPFFTHVGVLFGVVSAIKKSNL